jgi:membrane protein implicated in regulation of membrane protease activity
VRTWFDELTPLQAGLFVVVCCAAAYLALVYGLHWSTNIGLWSAMTVVFAALTARLAWQRQHGATQLPPPDADEEP